MDGWIRRRWERETRYYEALIHQDLWGGWVITRSWGQIGARLGRVTHTPCASYADAEEELKVISKRRKSHQYQCLAPND